MADKGVDKGADKGAELGYVGIDAILEQMRRKAMKQGFELNIMVVGECWFIFYHSISDSRAGFYSNSSFTADAPHKWSKEIDIDMLKFSWSKETFV